jgi:hypothetical protein
MEDKSFGQYLLSLGVVTHFGVVTGESSSCLACNRNARKVGAVTDNWGMVTCRQCLRIRSRWNLNDALKVEFVYQAVEKKDGLKRAR